jgi:hypothetical protein
VHEVLAAVPLILITLAYLVHQWSRRAALSELTKAGVLALGFLFWAANQLWPDHPLATLFNDIAIACFVLDVFLVIAPWAPTAAAKAPERSPPQAGLPQAKTALAEPGHTAHAGLKNKG